MPLHDAVGINCKKGTITENQGSGVKYIGYGVYLDDSRYLNLTRMVYLDVCFI